MYQSLLKRFTGLAQLRRDDAGAVLITGAVVIGALAIAIGSGIEMSRYASVKARFNNALDQATLAAGATDTGDNDIQAYARRYFDTNLKEYKELKVKNFSVEPNASHTSWHGRATAEVPLFFGAALGLGSMTVSHDVTVSWDNGTTSEVVAMVDVSGTMCANFKRTRETDGRVDIDFIPDRNCTKLDMMKEALKKIVDIGVGYSENAPEPLFKVGVVPFSWKVNLPNPRSVPSFMLKSETDSANAGGDGDKNYYTDLADANASGPPLPQVLPLRKIVNGSDKQAFRNDVDKLFTNNHAEFNRDFMKRSALGAEISGLMLDPRYNAMFGGERPLDFNAPHNDKIVIMMTDSANLGCCYTNWPDSNFKNHYIYSYNPDHKHLVGTGSEKGICQQMKEAGIKVYTVLLDVDKNDMDERGEEIVSAFETCATAPEMAFRIPLNDTEALKTAYQTIGTALLKLRVTR